MDARRQVLRPDDDATGGLALGDNLKTRNDFPSRGERSSLRKFSPGRPTGPDHDRLANEPARGQGRQGLEDDFQRRSTCHMAVALTVDKFGLDSLVSGLSEKVH